MKNIEVIDLLSSPELAAQERNPILHSPTNRTTITSPSARPIAPYILAAECSRASKDVHEWLYISDDPDSEHQVDVPCASKPSEHRDDHIGNPPSLNPNGASARLMAASPNSVFEGFSPVAATTNKGKGRAKVDADFFTLSDDVDVNANLNDPCLSDPFLSPLEPAPKRRRLTPEPSLKRAINLAAEKGRRLSRSTSNVTDYSRGHSIGTSKVAGLKRSKTSILDDDPIVFSSSPDLVRVARERRERLHCKKDLNKDDDDDNPFRTDAGSVMARAATLREYEDDSETSSDLDLPDVGAIASQSLSFPALSYTESKRTLAAYQAEKAALQKKRDKVLKMREKLNHNEEEKERKRLARVAKAKEKEMAADLAKVNTLRIDKKISTPEMIIDLPVDLEAQLTTQVRQFLEPLEVQCTEWSSHVPNVIKWRRKVESIYNEEMCHWEPAPKQIRPEKLVMCIMNAKEFVELATGEEGRDVDAHVLRMKARFSECEIIYLVEGLTIWMRKNRNVKNRQFTEAVRRQMDQGVEEATASASQRLKKRKQPEYVDEDMIEDTLLKLQVIHGARIHHTASTVDTAQWVMVFTQHISTIPYRHQRMTLDTAFCMDSGQVRMGTDAPDTFIKMLQEVNRVTAPIAYGIAAAHPSAPQLVRAFERHGRDALQGLRKCANRDGAFSDREIGTRLSRRLCGIFTGGDPGSLDV